MSAGHVGGRRGRLKDVGKTAASTIVRALRPLEVLAGAIDRGSSRESGLRAGGPSALGWAVRCLVDGFEAGCSRLPSPGCDPGPHWRGLETVAPRVVAAAPRSTRRPQAGVSHNKNMGGKFVLLSTIHCNVIEFFSIPI